MVLNRIRSGLEGKEKGGEFFGGTNGPDRKGPNGRNTTKNDSSSRDVSENERRVNACSIVTISGSEVEMATYTEFGRAHLALEQAEIVDQDEAKEHFARAGEEEMVRN